MTTLGELNAMVLATLERVSDTQAQAMLPMWRQLAEADIFAVLRAGWMTRRGDAIITSDTDTLPPSIIQIQSVVLLNSNVPDGDILRVVAADGSPITIGGGLQLVAGGAPRDAGVVREDIRALDAIGAENITPDMFFDGVPTAYLIEGRRIRLLPWPGTYCRVNLHYYSRGDALLDDNSTNETLYQLPNAYFYGMLKHAAIFYGDTDGQQRWTDALISTVTAANASSYDWQGTGFTARLG